MGEWTTLSVKEDTAGRFNRLKQDVDLREEPTQDKFLQFLLNAWEDGEKKAIDGLDISPELQEVLERVE